MLKKIDTIIFDIGKVLIDWNPMIFYIDAFNGDTQKAKWFLENVCNHDFNLALDAGKDWQQSIEEKVSEYPEYEKHIRMYLEHWEAMILGPINGTVEIFRKMKDSKKYRIYAITNWSDFTFTQTYEKYDFLKWFEGITVSGRIKIVKPDPAIYHYTLKKYSIEAGNSVFIDDNKANVDAAIELGINGILYTSPEELAASLKSYGIEI
jgi:2-haloacid dehalogenase